MRTNLQTVPEGVEVTMLCGCRMRAVGVQRFGQYGWERSAQMIEACHLHVPIDATGATHIIGAGSYWDTVNYDPLAAELEVTFGEA